MNNHVISNAIFRKILDEAPLPIGIYQGPEHRFVYINQAGADIVRMDPEEVIGKTYAEVLPNAKERISSIDRVYQTGVPFIQKEMELPITIDASGKPIVEFVNFLSQPYTDETGKIAGVSSFGTLVTAEVLTRKKLEEQSYRTLQILDNLGTGFFSVDRNWIFTYSNPAATPSLGLSPEEALGKHVWSVHPQLVETEFYHAYHKSMNERVVAEVTNYYPEQDRWYHTVSYPLDEGIAVSFTDVTNRKKAEEARAQSDERFHTLTEAMPQMVWITDANGLANYFNARWLEKTGTTMRENLGAGWLNVTHPEDRAVTETAWISAQTTRSYDVEYRVKMADGSYRWHVARGVPTIGQDGKIKQWVGTTTDIHAQKEAQNELRKAVEARDEFLSIASHELKTPLTVLKLQSELTHRNLKNPAGDLSAVGRLASTIDRNVQRLTRVVDDMLDISRVATGKLGLELEEVSVKELLLDCLERLRPLVADSGCDLTYLRQDDARITVDKFRLEQVIINLVSNACRYGKGKPVIISSTVLPESLRISVKDQGIGIPTADHKRIFERFERASSLGGGLGLGLFIVKSIVELHDGKIFVDSEPGKGSEFTVELPRRS